MNVERGKFEGDESPEERAEWDARIEAAVEKARMDPRCAHLFEEETEEEEAAAIARARVDIAAGRVYPHKLVAKWLETWGKPGRKSFHEWLNG